MHTYASSYLHTLRKMRARAPRRCLAPVRVECETTLLVQISSRQTITIHFWAKSQPTKQDQVGPALQIPQQKIVHNARNEFRLSLMKRTSLCHYSRNYDINSTSLQPSSHHRRRGSFASIDDCDCVIVRLTLTWYTNCSTPIHRGLGSGLI